MIFRKTVCKTVRRGSCLPVILLAALAAAGCSKSDHGGGVKAPPTPPAVSGVQLENVTVSTLPESLEAVGTVRARTSALVSARVPGVITLLKVREGDRVKKGELLAQLDARENQAAAAASAAGVEEAGRGLDEARARKKLAEITFDRYQKLLAEQAVTRQEFDVKQTELELARQGVARAEARLAQAREGGQATAAMAGYTRIVAPIAGIVSSRPADLGATVYPAQPLMTIEDEGSYLLELAIPESLAAGVRPGSPVTVTLDAVNSTFAAKISEVVPAVDPASRTYTAKISLSRPGLRSGMFGRGVLAVGAGAAGITVPQKAIVEQGALTSVWVVGSDRLARMRLVKTGKKSGDRVEILSGLSAGEQIVSGGGERVSEGAKVE